MYKVGQVWKGRGGTLKVVDVDPRQPYKLIFCWENSCLQYVEYHGPGDDLITRGYKLLNPTTKRNLPDWW